MKLENPLLSAIVTKLLASSKDMLALSEEINGLSNEDRILVREAAMAAKPEAPLPRNLFYNYETQRWI